MVSYPGAVLEAHTYIAPDSAWGQLNDPDKNAVCILRQKAASRGTGLWEGGAGICSRLFLFLQPPFGDNLLQLVVLLAHLL